VEERLEATVLIHLVLLNDLAENMLAVGEVGAIDAVLLLEVPLLELRTDQERNKRQ